MKSKYIKHISSGLFFLLFACDQGVTPPTPPPPPLPPPPPSFASLKNLAYTQTDYDWMQVQSAETLLFQTQDIELVSAGFRSGLAFIEETSVYPKYTVSEQGYTMTFNIKVNIGFSRTYWPLAIRYHFKDSSVLDVDTMISTLRYPYPTAELFLTNSIMDDPTFHFQDIDRIGDRFYYHGMGDVGIYEYDIPTQQRRELFGVASGDYMTAEFPFVFAESGQYAIHRYDLRTDSLVYSLVNYGKFGTIRGLDAHNGSLYVLARDTMTAEVEVLRYSYDGELQEEIPYPSLRSTYFMTIHNGILYSDNSYYYLSRFNISSGQFLPNIFAPASDVIGIRIVDGHLYYCDNARLIVGRIPIEDIE